MAKRFFLVAAVFETEDEGHVTLQSILAPSVEAAKMHVISKHMDANRSARLAKIVADELTVDNLRETLAMMEENDDGTL